MEKKTLALLSLTYTSAEPSESKWILIKQMDVKRQILNKRFYYLISLEVKTYPQKALLESLIIFAASADDEQSVHVMTAHKLIRRRKS